MSDQPHREEGERKEEKGDDVPIEVKEEVCLQQMNGGAPLEEKGQSESQPISEQFISADAELSGQLKAEGNQLFKEEQYLHAIGKYRQALRYTEPEEGKVRSVLYSNISICLSRQDSFKEAVRYCRKATQCDPSYAKAQLNLAAYLERAEELDEALGQYRKLLEGSPKDVKTEAKVKDLERRVEERNQQQKKEVVDGLKNIGNSVLGYFGLSLDNFKMEQGAGGGYNVSFKQ